MHTFDKSISLRIQAEVAWIPLATSMVELGGATLGLDTAKTRRLTLATEEIITHLVSTAPGTEILFTLKPGGWHVLAQFSFKADPSDLWAMNIVPQTDVSVHGDMDNVGLLLASRMVDDFTLELKQGMVHLNLRQDRTYSQAVAVPETRRDVKGSLDIAKNIEPALIKVACSKALNHYPAHVIHPSFTWPGKFADMVAQGDLDVAIITDESGALAGMICWQSNINDSISFWGPYTFVQGDQAGSLLTEHLVHRVARTQAVGLFSEMATAELPTGDFELLGHVSFTQENGNKLRQDCWFRHLQEDVGATVWSPASLVEFLEEVYEEQVLMRNIQVIDKQEESIPERSLFSAHLQPEIGQVSFIPMVFGSDAKECIEHHVTTLVADKYTNIFFRIDLGYAWQTALADHLMENGFAPKLVLPYGGKSDVVVFQYE